MAKGIGGHHRGWRGASDVWLTPKYVTDALGPFDLDPCSLADRPWDTAARHVCPPDDGLAVPWEGRVWLNPPYGPALGGWLARLADHGDGIAIAFARTETATFRRFVWERADGLLFLYGRLHFCRADGTRAKANAGGPSVLIAYGAANAECLRGCGLAGKYVHLAGAGD